MQPFYKYNECCYIVNYYNMLLHTSLQELRQNINQRLNPQKTPHTLPWRASYGVSFVNILEKIDDVITTLHCISVFHFCCKFISCYIVWVNCRKFVTCSLLYCTEWHIVKKRNDMMIKWNDIPWNHFKFYLWYSITLSVIYFKKTTAEVYLWQGNLIIKLTIT